MMIMKSLFVLVAWCLLFLPARMLGGGARAPLRR